MLDKKSSLLGLGVFFLVVMTMIPMINVSSFWFDEYFTINLIRKPWLEIIELTAVDVHPPLYYFVLKAIVSIMGESAFSLRLVSVISFGVIVGAGVCFTAHYYNTLMSLAIAMTLVSVPNMIYFATEIRMYSMSMMWVFLSFLVTKIVIEKFTSDKMNKWWFFLAFFNVAAAYTHYFAGVAAIGISFCLLLFLLFTYKEKKSAWKSIIVQWIVYCVTMMVAYLPWIFVLFKQMKAIHGKYWIGKIDFQNILSEEIGIIWDMPMQKLKIILIALFVVGYFFVFIKCKKKIWLIGGLLTTVFWFFFAIAYSVWITPILIARYVVILLPILWMPVIISLVESSNKFKSLISVLFIILIMSSCFTVNWKERNNAYIEDKTSVTMEKIEQMMQSQDVMFHVRVQELVAGETYFPKRVHFFKRGLDKNEAFHYWPDLTGCVLIDDLSELKMVEGDIWCISSDFIPLFEELGFSVEEININNMWVYRIYMSN